MTTQSSSFPFHGLPVVQPLRQSVPVIQSPVFGLFIPPAPVHNPNYFLDFLRADDQALDVHESFVQHVSIFVKRYLPMLTRATRQYLPFLQ